MKSAGHNARVFLVAKAYPPVVGGVESYSELIARAYVRHGATPIILSSWEGQRGWHDLAYPEGIIRVFNVGMASQPVVFARLVAACGRIRFTQKFDFIHATTWRPALALLPWFWPQKKVLTVHGQEVLNFPAILKHWMIWVLRTFDLVETVSQSTMHAAKGALEGARPRGIWEVNFNGLSFPEEAAAFNRPVRSTELPVRILSFARLAKRKNFHRCLQALSKLRDSGITNFHYTIAGTGPLKSEIENLIKELDMSNFVTMLGYVDDVDITGLYRNADIFLHPQTAAENHKDLEGFGLAIADSISFGCAAVVGKDGGPSDFVLHEERGLVVDGYDIDMIAEALERLITQPELQARLSSKGRQWCLENLSWDRHISQVIQSIERLYDVNH